MKKIISSLLIVVLLMTSAALLSSCNQKGHNDDETRIPFYSDEIPAPTPNEYFAFTLLDDGTYSVAAKDKNNLPYDIVIPSEYERKPVTAIADEAFSYCYNISRIYIPEGVTTIGNGAFKFCVNILAVKLSNTVTTINESAFTYCGQLVNIVIPKSVTYISRAFDGCDKLVEVYNLSSLDIKLGEKRVDMTFGFTGAKVIHKSIEEKSIISIVDEYIFAKIDEKPLLISYTGNSSNLVLPDSCNGENYGIYDWAFAPQHRSNINYSEMGVDVSKMYTDTNLILNVLYNIKSITIPKKVDFIGRYAFFGCENLESAIFENTEGWWKGCTFSNGYLEEQPLSQSEISDTSSAAIELLFSHGYDLYLK